MVQFIIKGMGSGSGFEVAACGKCLHVAVVVDRTSKIGSARTKSGGHVRNRVRNREVAYEIGYEIG